MGKVDPGETPRQAVIRETLEEANLRVKGLLKVAESRGKWGTLTTYMCTAWTGTPKPNWESSDMRWADAEDALKLDLVPGLRALLKAMLRIQVRG